ncbi:MAG TPA: histidine kinase [Pyrinomonadaceae bacterium]|jgi:signal transduction histidine kinase
MQISLADKKLSFQKSLDVPLISEMRAILALSMLFVTFLDPSEPRQYVALTYTSLTLYSLYALIVYFVSFRKPGLIADERAHWLDLLWCLLLITLSSGTSSIYFFLFFFSILIAAFRFGFSEGIKVTTASVISFIVLGYLTAPVGEEFELNRFLLRPVYLGVLGYMLSYWGGIELKLKRRLELIKDINNLYNPRFGTDLTIRSILQKILDSFDADSCLLISFEAGTEAYTLRQCDRANPKRGVNAESLPPEHPLVKLPGDSAVIFNGLHNRRLFGKPVSYLVFDPETQAPADEPSRNGELLADLLNTESLISVPFDQRGKPAGRLFLTSGKHAFDTTDADFLRQILAQAVPVIENVNLLDRLASEATEQQRLKISRDIHDSAVQPYIGIKLGLEALQIKQANGVDVKDDIARLVEIANTNIAGIRNYINRLKGDATGKDKGVVLVSAIRQQAKKISEFYGIKIDVEATDEIHINDRLSAEIFQIVTEGLSNIKRHTQSKEAAIKISCGAKMLKLEIENKHANGAPPVGFVPVSISGRAHSLGGGVAIENRDDLTRVLIDIPL